MRIFVMSLTIFLASFLIGCSSLPEPKTENDTLVIGIIKHTGDNYVNYVIGSSLNGTKTNEIQMTIKNINTNENFIIKTQKNGLFYYVNLSEGLYRIERLFIRISVGSGFVTTFSRPETDYFFSIINGKINNLGVINWSTTLINYQPFSVSADYILSQLYNDVIIECNKQFTKSEWLKKDIVQITMEN